MIRTLAVLLLLATSALAQTNWAGAGVAYGRPHVNGWASFAYLLSDTAKLYSFTSMDVTAYRGQPQHSMRSGLATVIRKAGPVTVLGFGEAGMATVDSSISGAFDGGGVAIIRLGKSGLTLALAARVLSSKVGQTQTVYEIGFGRSY